MEEFVERTVRSAVAQTYPNIRVLAVNDGSTDGSAAVLERLADELPTFDFVSTENGGVAKARNHGTELAETDYVAYLDADDLWHPAKIERQVAALVRLGEDPEWGAAYTLYRVIDRHDRTIKSGPAHDARGRMFDSHLVNNQVGNGSSILVRRDAALEVGGFDPSYAARGIGGCEDFDFQLRLLRRYKMEVVREYLVGYRQHAGAMSLNRRAMAGSYLAVIDSFVDDPAISPELRAAALTSAQSYAWHRLIRSGEVKSGLRAYVSFLRSQPADAIAHMMRRMQFGVRNLVDRVRKTSGYPTPTNDAMPLFASLAPDEGLAEEMERRKSHDQARLGFSRSVLDEEDIR